MGKLTAIIDQSDPRYVVLELLNGQGSMSRKKVTYNNFLKLLQSSSEKDATGIVVGRLPNGYYNACVSEDGFKVIVSVPAGIFPFQYFDDVFTIPFPRLVFKFTCRDGKVVERVCYAAKDDILTDQTELFHYPYANVYESGTICFGGNMLPECSELADIDKVINIFYGAPSNNDLWKESYCGLKYPALRIALQELNGKDAFPLDYLQPYINGGHIKNVSSLLSDFTAQ